MLKRGFLKSSISIEKIGSHRFWPGIAMGLIMAVVLSVMFNHWREALRFTSSFFGDLITLNAGDQQFYNFFFASLATSLGMAFTISFWFSGRNHLHKREKIFRQLTISNAWLYFWIVLIVTARFGLTLTQSLHTAGYDNHLDLRQEFTWIFYLLPLVLFLQCWASIRLFYKAEHWMAYAFLAFPGITAALAFATAVNPDKINTAFNNQYLEEYKYIEGELERANTLYGISYPIEAEERLKQWYTEGADKQLLNIQGAFSKTDKVSMDTILLQQMVVHNLKVGARRRHSFDLRKNWRYAYPADILRQIKKRNPDEAEVIELYKILQEYVIIFNTDDDVFFSKPISDRERKLMFFKYRLKVFVPLSVFQELEAVIDELEQEKQYAEYNKMLPVLLQDTAGFRN